MKFPGRKIWRCRSEIGTEERTVSYTHLSRTIDSYCGLNAGHGGIYIGNGQSASNIGGVAFDTIESWTAYYGFGGWGWGGAVVAQK